MKHLKKFNESHNDYYELCTEDSFMYKNGVPKNRGGKNIINVMVKMG